MNKILLFFFLPICFLYSQTENKHAFIGLQGCSPCHKTEKQGKQLEIWQNSKHSRAYETLKTEEANKIAKDLGLTTPAIETEDCLRCHASGYNVDASLLEKKFKIEDGVQCETCHGAGADYKSNKIMKDHAAAVANGLVEINNIETFCKGCHNPDSPTYKGLNFAEAWETIKHPVPEK
jgi:hypothetical protein